MDGWMDGRKEGRMDGWMEGRKEGRKEGWKDGRKEGWMEGRKEGRKEGWMDGRMDGWMDSVWTGHTFFHWVLVPPANLPIAAEGSAIGVHPTEWPQYWKLRWCV
jgi:hypothetical protein